MHISLIKEEEEHILKVLPILLKRDLQFKESLYGVLGETFVKRDDFSELKGIVRDIGIKVSELAEAQKRTEIRVEELVEAQRETQKQVQELAQAQKRTEIELNALGKDIRALTRSHEDLKKSHEDLKKQVGGISHTIGYELEEKFYLILPKVIKEDFGAEIETYLERRYLLYPDGKDDEINIYASGRLNGKRIYLIGESKVQLGKNDIDDFAKKLKRVKNYLKEELLPIFLCYIVHPKVEKYLKEKYPDIKIYKSFELKRRECS